MRPLKIACGCSFKAFGLAGALALAAGSTAMAGEAMSWNLSRDMMDGIKRNPDGVWAFMQNSSGEHDPAKYTLLPNYYGPIDPYGHPMIMWGNDDTERGFFGVPTKTFVWSDYLGTQVTSRKGIPYTHPGRDGTQTIVRWKSPVTLTDPLK